MKKELQVQGVEYNFFHQETTTQYEVYWTDTEIMIVRNGGVMKTLKKTGRPSWKLSEKLVRKYCK